MMKKSVFAIVLAATLLLTGCWDSHELDELSIVVGVALDKGNGADMDGMDGRTYEEPDGQNSSKNVLLTVQVANIQGESSGSSSNPGFFLLENESGSLLSSLNFMNFESSRFLYMQHNPMIIISEELAREGIIEYVDYYMRDYFTRKEAWLFISKGKAKDMIGAQIPQSQIASMGIVNMMANDQGLFDVIGINLLEFTTDLMETAKAPIIPVLELSEENEINTIWMTGLGVFDEDVLIDVLDLDEIRGFVWTVNGIQTGIIKADSDSGSATLRVSGSKHEIKPVIREDGGVDFIADIFVRLSIGEVRGFESISLEELHKTLEEMVREEVDQLIQNTLKRVQELGADIYGFGSLVHKRYPSHWKDIKDNWKEMFTEVSISANIEVDVASAGRLTQPLVTVKGEEK
ncbi:MAG: Ger(x)C family spore germination protein [Christensenellales bacterium]|jgi:spore germination protein KC